MIPAVDRYAGTRDAHGMKRVLIVDDDPISLRFLEAAVGECGCVVVLAGDGAQALAAADGFDLMLIDRHLPDTNAVDLLHHLRAQGIDTPAIATSAEIDSDVATQLRAAGFADVLEKPAPLQRIGEIVSRHLPRVEPALLDDASALAAIGGDANALRALRGLLAQELEQLGNDLDRSNTAIDATALDARLHRLRASCGFCGAPALAQCAAEIQSSLRAGDTLADARRRAFAARCRDTARVLRG
ncbi:MAG: response regulator [Proteobacteria bacterium]|nr:response regulator [Pseudomonadota bacterium]